MPSASLVTDDPALLFTVAGMVPFIPYLSGDVPAPVLARRRRAEVHPHERHRRGRQDPAARHVLPDARQLVVRRLLQGRRDPLRVGPADVAEADGRLAFDPKDLWVTVYEEDDEAYGLWQSVAGVPEDRIQRLGKDTNYWSTGLPGSGRPVLRDLLRPRARNTESTAVLPPTTTATSRSGISSSCSTRSPMCARSTDFDIVGELPAKNIDTGMGLERVAFIKQGVDNMYETDQVRPVLDRAVEFSGRRYGADHEDDVRFRVVADHIRSSLMLLSDGVTPVQRRTRLHPSPPHAPRYPLDATSRCRAPTFPELFTVSRDAMKDAYPVVATTGERISQYALAEEETFLRTLAAGRRSWTRRSRRRRPRAERARRRRGLPAARHLRLPDRPDARDRRRGRPHRRPRGVRHPHAGAARPRQGRRQVAQAPLADPSVYRDLRAKGETVFTGYTDLETESSVLGILLDGRVRRPRERRARSPRSSSPRPLCMPSPAARSPTRA